MSTVLTAIIITYVLLLIHSDPQSVRRTTSAVIRQCGFCRIAPRVGALWESEICGIVCIRVDPGCTRASLIRGRRASVPDTKFTEYADAGLTTNPSGHRSQGTQTYARSGRGGRPR